MKSPSDPPSPDEALRERLIGLGEHSLRKSYYPELQQQLVDLERFKVFLDHSIDAIFLLEIPSVRIVDTNEAPSRLLGWSRQELLERSLFNLTDLADNPRVRALIGRSEAAESERLLVETLLYKPDGSGIPVEMTIVRLLFQNRDYAIAVARDIEKRKRAEQELLTLNQELEARVLKRTKELELINRELETFTYSVSHDLRAPLRAINGFSEALLEDYADRLDEEGKTYLRYLQEGSRDMNELIEGLLKLSRSTRGELLRERIDLSVLVETVVDELRRAEPERHVVVQIAPGMWAKADRRLLKVVLDNLLGNAWKYSSQKQDARIEVGIEEQEGERAYLVKDNGAGFDMTFVDKLFIPFQRLHRADEFKGTGIGLATVERIIHRHGGRIWAKSVVGEGASFYFTLGERH